MLQRCLVLRKLERFGYHYAEESMMIRYAILIQYWRVTDGWTDRIATSISRVINAVLMRSKKQRTLLLPIFDEHWQYFQYFSNSSLYEVMGQRANQYSLHKCQMLQNIKCHQRVNDR